MNRKTQSAWRLTLMLGAIVLGASTTALAGPPLICHPFDIATAKSLPWGNANGANHWDRTMEGYDLSRLTADTLALLSPETPIIVRMETLRRATIYAKTDPVIAKQLVLKLRARAFDAEAEGRPDALAWFDIGYLVECMKQANWLFEKTQPANGQAGIREEAPNIAMNLDGLVWVQKAINLRGNDPQMEFAAALVLIGRPDRSSHPEHAQKALRGAKNDALLARNLETHLFGAQGDTMATLFVKEVSGSTH